MLNASLAGVIDGCRDRVGGLFGARFGVSGLLEDDLADLLAVSQWSVRSAARTPGSAIGSSRRALDDAGYERVLAGLRARDIGVLFYTGGNGSMHTALEISRRTQASGQTLQVIGIPKTIDNDLLVTHHTPGYASTGYFFACAAREAGIDNRSLPSPVCVLETLGRNAGWITAATALARVSDDDAPHLIYLPERRVSLDRIAADVERVYRRRGRVVVAVCEGQRDEGGGAFGAEMDRAGSAVNELASNLGHTLSRLITQKTGLRARAEKPGLMGRSCGPFARESDRRDAYDCGRAAVRAALAGESEVMVALNAGSTTFLTPLATVAGTERALPAEWISAEGNDVTADFRAYAAPLIGEVQGYGAMF